MDLMLRRFAAAASLQPAGSLVTKTDPGTITLTDPTIRKLAVTFLPIQAAGTPSPTNVLPVSGRTSVSAAIGASTFTTALGSTIYGGTVDLVSGTLSVAWASVKISALTWSYESTNTRFSAKIDNLKKYSAIRTTPFYASVFQPITDGRAIGSVPNNSIYSGANSLYCYIKKTDISSIPTFVATYGDIDLVYPLATPQTVQLTPQTINVLTGQQTVSSDAGSIEITYYGY